LQQALPGLPTARAQLEPAQHYLKKKKTVTNILLIIRIK
jgi:hypothetical protein